MPEDSRFQLAGSAAHELAVRFGTPLYVLDEATFRSRIRALWAAFHAAWPRMRLNYASKANGTLAVLAIAHREGCWIDVASEGELQAALAAGVPASRCCFHGNNKSANELLFGLEQGVGEIVVDNFEELAALAVQSSVGNRRSSILLRLAPGVSPQTHAHISTGQEDTKFGFSIADGSAERAVRYCLDRGLPLVGFHCHVGSQLLDPEAQIAGAEAIAHFAADMKRTTGFEANILDMGGGIGARYTDEAPMPFDEYCRRLVSAVSPILKEAGLSPLLVQEPGRAVIAEAGVTLYTVGVVKHAGGTRYVVVDGGMADNPRPALYGARYEAQHLTSAERKPTGSPSRTVLAGRHCEADTLIDDVDLPEGIEPGDLIQVLTTGAYSSSMASNYNRYPRPATVLLREDGRVELVQRRESIEEMLAREIILEDL